MKDVITYSPPEAAFIADRSLQFVQKLVDDGPLTVEVAKAGKSLSRRFTEVDIIFARLAGELTPTLSPEARKIIYTEIRERGQVPDRVAVGIVLIETRPARQAVRERIRRLRNARRNVVCDPDIRGGEPTVLGTRIPVYMLADISANGATLDDLLEDYPSLDRERLVAALDYAAAYPPRGRPKKAAWRK